MSDNVQNPGLTEEQYRDFLAKLFSAPGKGERQIYLWHEGELITGERAKEVLRKRFATGGAGPQ